MNGNRKRVVVTGASGTIAGLLLPAMRDRYDLVALDIKPTDPSGGLVDGVQIADLLQRDRDTYREYFRDADAVVHCAFVHPKDPDDSTQRFYAEMANIGMAFNVYQTAWEESVRRVVVASSNHAADYYEPLILRHEWDYVTPDMRALSDNYYGWAKESYEHLGFVFAVGHVNGTPLENIQIRIGAPRETDLNRCALGDHTCMRRALAAYISQRDLVQLFVKSIEADDIRDAHGVPFQIFYGVSNNPHAFWSIVNARRVLGYEPQDSSEVRFGQMIAEQIRAAMEHNGRQSARRADAGGEDT
ncbi:MAG: NAD(P)-dependent oxidoreductase [Chloroflexi bacterium]|nr:NAD(P)-dependent oxidoreductase [Chloroflexota bacterium]